MDMEKPKPVIRGGYMVWKKEFLKTEEYISIREQAREIGGQGTIFTLLGQRWRNVYNTIYIYKLSEEE